MIFNKDDNGSVELKALIGFIYASIEFSNLKTYIDFAERDIIRLISKEVFDAALNHYMSENYQVEQDQDHPHPEYAVLDDLVSKIQYPVAVLAYRRYVPSNDVVHSDQGRQIYVSEEQKPAFEWQIEKDNANLLSLAGEAIDVLLEFLDEHIDDMKPPVPPAIDGTEYLIPWGNSDAYKATKKLFVNSAKEFEKYFFINRSRRLFLTMVPIMTRIQENELRPCFTEEKYDELKEQILDKDINDSNLAIVNYASGALVLLSLAVAVKRISAEILPDGIFVNSSVNVVKTKLAAGKVDRNEISNNLEQDGMRELVKLQNELHRIELMEAGTSEILPDLADRFDEQAKFARF